MKHLSQLKLWVCHPIRLVKYTYKNRKTNKINEKFRKHLAGCSSCRDEYINYHCGPAWGVSIPKELWNK